MPLADTGAQMRRLLAEAQSLPPAGRAALLMDWIMERIDATRCALVPIAVGAAGPPLAFHLRGRDHAGLDPRRIPRSVVAHVASSRQPLVVADASVPQDGVDPTGTIELQGVRSFMAMPVLLQDQLIAIAYLDRLDRAQPFSLEDQEMFATLAHELARPLVGLIAAQRTEDVAAVLGDATAGLAMSSRSPALQAVVQRALKLAPHADLNLLLLGETGVGKEWLARLIHDASQRSGPFLAINACAIPSELFESELMGSVRGAYTGASDRIGAFERAANGTLFLDEIGDLELPLQARLLRFFEDRLVRPVGGRPKAVDVRIIGATNRPVADMVARGTFRLDLLQRFAPPLTIPPLRNRVEEIVPLAESWLAGEAARRKLPVPPLDAAMRDLLRHASWPGNVRELHAALSQVLLLSPPGTLDRELLRSLLIEDATPSAKSKRPGEPSAMPGWDAFTADQESREREYLNRLLEESGNNVEAAARAAGCPASTLRSALKRHGIGRSR